MDSYNKTKAACFLTSASTAITGNLSPLLFVSFMKLYSVSYTRLGFLIVVNFGTQLLFDLFFSFFSEKLNVKFFARITPFVVAVGLVLFGLAPSIFHNNIYLGLVIATVVFSCGSGLAEVLISPIVAAIPSKNSPRLMSALHSCYAWGVVGVVIITTLFLSVFGIENWQWLSIGFALFPFIASALFFIAPIPDTEPDENVKTGNIFTNKVLWLCVLAIFLGGASECTMSQWCSSYLEQAFNIPKTQGDIFGVALFGCTLGLGRTLYASFGKKIEDVLFFGSLISAFCYIGAVAFSQPILGMLSCALTGFFVSMLWPGSLIATQKLVPNGGIAMFAIMAAGGDLGASLVPQAVGIIADAVTGSVSGGDAEQLAMKTGLAFATIIPFAAFIVFGIIRKKVKALDSAEK